MTINDRRVVLELLLAHKNRYRVYAKQSVCQKDRSSFLKWKGKLILINRLIAYFYNEAPTIQQMAEVLNEKIQYSLSKGGQGGRARQHQIPRVFYTSQAHLACKLLVDLVDLSGSFLP